MSDVAVIGGSSTSLFRVSEPRSRFLLVVNKGPGALHLPREGTDWDLLEIYFMDRDIKAVTADPSLSSAEHIVFETDRQMRKFAIVKAAFTQNNFWDRYDAVILADDDLMPVGCTVGDIFKLFADSGCDVGQPALSVDSYFAHMITIQNKSFLWRKTNFAEVMCPIFSKEGLRRYLPIFDATVSGFGLDDYWSYSEWLSGRGCVILDQTPMKHTRPVRGGIAYQGITPEDECVNFMRKFSIPRYPHSSYGGKLRDGVIEHAPLASYMAGYDRRFIHDPRYVGYVIDEAQIQASQPPAPQHLDATPELRDYVANLRHIAGVGLYLSAKSTGMLAPMTSLDDVQNQIKQHLNSTTWRKTEPVRKLVAKSLGRELQVTPPVLTNPVTAQRYLDTLRHSTIWRMTGPVRRMVELLRRR